uniref:RING-type E3 ubiquitin transferase n=1 Tax=Sinocyclocheilus rhinocerous TaxID=307959 RepID=A0A673L3U6_9TELE
MVKLSIMLLFYKSGHIQRAAFYVSSTSQEIPNFQPDHHLLRILNASSNKRLHYVAVEGLVQATGEPISSQFVPRCHGVIQKITVHEHWKYWNSVLKTCTILTNRHPAPDEVSVRVDSPLEASGDYLEQVHKRLRQAKEGLMDAVVRELSGEKPVEREEREELLRVGSALTAFGELVLEQDKIMRLQPPRDGRSYVLIPSDYKSFIQRHENSANMWKGLMALFGITAFTLVAELADWVIVFDYCNYETYDIQNHGNIFQGLCTLPSCLTDSPIFKAIHNSWLFMLTSITVILLWTLSSFTKNISDGDNQVSYIIFLSNGSVCYFEKFIFLIYEIKASGVQCCLFFKI